MKEEIPVAFGTPSPPVILIVDDDPLLLLLAVEIVQDAGFDPIEASDADEAIAILESRSDIVLLFTDINMPGSMDGLKLAHVVRDRWPPIKIMVTSGLMRLSASELPLDSRFLSKPYHAAILISELRSLVGTKYCNDSNFPALD